jgi:hypothetical protein
MRAPCLIAASLAWTLEGDLVQQEQVQALFSKATLFLDEV